MIGVLLLPLVIALALVPLRRWRFVATPLATTGALVTGISLLTMEMEPLLVMGRILELTSRQQAGLGYCSLLLAATLLMTYRLPQERLHYALAMLALTLLIAATAASSLTLGAILLQLGMLVSVMTLSSDEPGAAERGIRVVVLVVLAGMLLLFGSWALESSLAQPDQAGYPAMMRTTLVLGLIVALGVAPGTLYLGSAQAGASPLAIVVCNVLMPAAILFRAGELLGTGVSGGLLPTTVTLGLWIGAVTMIFGNLGALLQRNVGKMLGYVATADLGMVLIGLSLNSETSVALALVHFGIRGVALLLGGSSAGVLRQCYGRDDLSSLEGSYRLAPWAVVGTLAAGLCLAGFPPFSGFSTRLSLLRELAQNQWTWIPWLVVASLGGIVALVRFGLAVTAPQGSTGQREPLWYRVTALPLMVLLLIVAAAPHLVHLLPPAWLDALFGRLLFPGA